MNTPGTRQWSESDIRRRFISPELVEGIVLVSVVIAVANKGEGIRDVFVVTILSVLVFWATDVFAHTVAVQRRRADEDRVQLRVSLRHALYESRGFLFAGILPAVFLLLGLFGAHEGEVAYWTALWAQVALLGVIGWIAFGGRGIPWYWRVCGTLATAALGMLAIALKIFVH
ncbi:hypothetical protein ASD65_08355 [Microbacterium sp. Root61]|uniref:hypothetical protein n=1 Tax=Microbacterium sp. Root61 TaxID=1736570 RepID=UPI0006F1FB89|nr:hypothetical protein [Microbacterium sp. Root61]KRA24432.1 hypothetical protein ASD65_08355 [Microbacterium sp. Root61]